MPVIKLISDICIWSDRNVDIVDMDHTIYEVIQFMQNLRFI